MSNLRQAIDQKYIHIKMNVYKNIYKSLTYKNSLIYFKKTTFYTNRTSYNKIRQVGSILEL